MMTDPATTKGVANDSDREQCKNHSSCGRNALDSRGRDYDGTTVVGEPKLCLVGINENTHE